MIKLKCHTSVIMHPTGEVAFKAGEEYEFNMNASGEISCPVPNGIHIFRARGEDAWTTYFMHELDNNQ